MMKPLTNLLPSTVHSFLSCHYCTMVQKHVQTCLNMSSFVLNSFPLIVPRRGPEIQICLSGWISWARTNPTPPPMCFYDEPNQSYNVTLLPFILDCLVVLQFIFYPINLRPSTVFLFFCNCCFFSQMHYSRKNSFFIGTLEFILILFNFKLYH